MRPDKPDFYLRLGAALALAILPIWWFVSGGGSSRFDRYLIGATYHVWYPGNFGEGFLRERLDPPQAPALGRYDSRDPQVAERHIAWCRRYGIDFLALDWWPRRPEQNRAIQDGFLKAGNLGDIKFCVFYETWELGARTDETFFDGGVIQRFVADGIHLAETFFSHPSYLKVHGRPVLFYYLTRLWRGGYVQAVRELRAEWQKRGFEPFLIGDEVFWWALAARPEGPRVVWDKPQKERIILFDALTSYNMYSPDKDDQAGFGAASTHLDQVARVYESYRKAGGRVVVVPNVMPGFNDRGVRPAENHPAIHRQWAAGQGEGSFLARSLDRLGLPFADPKLPMLMVTSFNEWNEDTQIEPVALAPPTARDQGPGGQGLTEGYAYAGYGETYLEVLRDKVAAVAGRVVDQDGRPVGGAEVEAYRNGKKVTGGRTDRAGYYTLSRYKMPEGEYEVGVKDGPSRRSAAVRKDAAATVDLVATEKAAP
jgi:hypothetical protein